MVTMDIWQIATLALTWGIVAFFLHATLHELAHAIAGKMFGGRILSFKPYPGYRDGHFRWASITLQFDKELDDRSQKFLRASPLLLEGFWFAGLVALMPYVPFPILVILIVEMVATAVDMTTWFIGFVLNREWTDGGKFYAQASWLDIVCISWLYGSDLSVAARYLYEFIKLLA